MEQQAHQQARDMRRGTVADLTNRVQQRLAPMRSAPQCIRASDEIGRRRKRAAREIFAQLALRHGIRIVPKLDQQPMPAAPTKQSRAANRIHALRFFSNTVLAEPQAGQALRMQRLDLGRTERSWLIAVGASG